MKNCVDMDVELPMARSATQLMSIDCWCLVAEKLDRNDRVWFAMACSDFYWAVRKACGKLDSPVQSVIESKERIHYALLHMLENTWDKMRIYDMIPVMAAEQNRTDVLNYAIDLGMSFNVHCLYRATAKGHVDIVREIIRIKRPKTWLHHKLFEAVGKSGSCEMCLLIISTFFNHACGAEEYYGQFLKYATKHGQLQLLRYILEEQPGSIGDLKNPQPILWRFLRNVLQEIQGPKQAAILDFLLKKHARILYLYENRVDERQFSPFFPPDTTRIINLALCTGDWEKVHLAENNGFTYNDESMFFAVMGNKLPICKYVYKKFHQPEKLPLFHVRDLIYKAVENNNMEILRWLTGMVKKRPLKDGAIVCDKCFLETALKNGNKEMLVFLLDICTDACKQSMHALAKANLADEFFKAQSKITNPSKYDTSQHYVHYAIENGNLDFARKLVRSGATLSRTDPWQLRAKWPGEDWCVHQEVGKRVRQSRKDGARKRKRK